MSSTTMQVISAPTVSAPRGALVVSALASFFNGVFGARKPAVPTRAQEAAAVREMARQLQYTDPGFASDLFAAASRHEGLDD
jgi:hypothetical protein